MGKRFTREEVIKWISDNRPDVTLIGEYYGSGEPMQCICNTCNQPWYVRLDDLKQGHRHNNCIRNQSSFMEKFFTFSYISVLGADNIVARDRQVIGKELDIYIPSRKIALEIGSWHWHKNSLNQDENKSLLCNNKGIKLLTIYDLCPLEEAPFDDCFCYKEDFSIDRNRKKLREAVQDSFKAFDIHFSITEREWKEIESKAKDASRILTRDDFNSLLARIGRDDVILIGDYLGANNKTLFRCLNCGNEWFAVPNSIKRGDGRHCRKCKYRNMSSRLALTTDDYRKWLEENRNDVSVVGEYINARTAIEHRCLICGNTFYAKPHNIKNGNGHRPCSYKRAGEKIKQTIAKKKALEIAEKDSLRSSIDDN